MATLDIWNRALNAADARGRVTSLTEKSPEAEVLTTHYDHVLKLVQSAAWWPSSRALNALALITTRDDTTAWTDTQPEPGFEFAYTPPADMLRPWHMTDFSRFVYGYNMGNSRLLINSNLPSPILVYARLEVDPNNWTADQTNATVYGLAAMIAGPLTGKTSVIQRNIQLANNTLNTARASAANDMGGEVKTKVPWLAARGYYPYETNRFYYPYGDIFPDAN